ncbi:MAG: hypothetical protein HW421_3851 [Ignavibacteria bacterium]|nr:hypothetical protein [Ignavibacteria bacterium]
MKFKYFQETNSMFIKFNDKQSVDSIEISDGVIADLDENENVVGIEFYSVKDRINLQDIVFEQFPMFNINFINKPHDIEKVT